MDHYHRVFFPACRGALCSFTALFPQPARTADAILRAAEDTLRTAEQGLSDVVNGPPERRLAGLRNAVVFGRAVTNVLENLRGVDPAFDAWYKPVAAAISDDPLMRFFYKLRSEILKKGSLGVAGSVSIHNLNLPEDVRRFGAPPPNACGFFAGDAAGGVGWNIRLPDGSIEKYYVDLPADIGRIEALFVDAPKHGGTTAVPECRRALRSAGI
jgi:hypothetical protein